jgi:hypothetical protein
MRGIVVTIDAGEVAGGYGGSTMKLAGRVQRHAFDAAVVALALVAQIEIWATPMPAPREALVPIMLLATLPLLLRGRFPFAAPVWVFGVYAALSAVDREAVSSLDTNAFTLLLAFWAVGAQDEARQAVAGVAIGCASIAVLVERDVRIEPADAIGVGDRGRRSLPRGVRAAAAGAAGGGVRAAGGAVRA